MSDGALSFFLDRFVRSRVSRVTYGTTMNHRYLPNNDDHRKRFSATYVDPNTGERAIRGAFDVILPKVSLTAAQNQSVFSITLSGHLSFVRSQSDATA